MRASSALATGRVAVWFLFIEEEEYRFLDGRGKDRKAHSTRFERLPVDIIDEVVFADKSDYLSLLPEGLPETFTAEEYRKAAKIPSEIPLFTLQGGMALDRLHGPYRFAIRMLTKGMAA